ncbi:unnamed protein product, partial [Bubo scandiacus]
MLPYFPGLSYPFYIFTLAISLVSSFPSLLIPTPNVFQSTVETPTYSCTPVFLFSNSNSDISRFTDLTTDKCCHSGQDGERKTEHMDAGSTEELEMATFLWKVREAVGAKVLDHFGKDNSTRDTDPAAAPVTTGAQGDMANYTYLVQKTRLVGDHASLRRELEATLNILGCWGSHR